MSRFAPSLLLCLVAAACTDSGLDFAPSVPRSDVTGCYLLDLGGASGPAREAPQPPRGLRLTENAFLPAEAPEREVARHRFDARAAREGFLVYPDTALRVAWWWESEADRRFGVGNRNTWAAFYVEAVVRGEEIEGDMHRFLYDDQGRPTQGPDAWSVPIRGRRESCAVL